MNFKADLIIIDRVNSNKRLYTKQAIKSYLSTSKKRIVLVFSDEDMNEVIGAGRFKLRGNILSIEGKLRDNIAVDNINKKFISTGCIVNDFEEKDGNLLVNSIVPDSMVTCICDSSSFTKVPNIIIKK